MKIEPVEEFDIFPTACNTYLVIRKSDSKCWIFKNRIDIGVYFHLLYNRVKGDESRITNPIPVNIPII